MRKGGVTLKAIVSKGGGSIDKLHLDEVPKPTPKENELLIKVKAGTVTRGDLNLRKIPALILVPMGWVFGFKRMKITGIEFSGIVERTGKNVKHFKAGDEVFGTTTGLKYGANAEYVCIPEKSKMGVLALKPRNLSFEESAPIPVGSMTALFNLKKMGIRPGDRLLVYGASGSVGSYAVQLAKHYGAEVTAVTSTKNLDLVRSLGADRVIDYSQESVKEKFYGIFDAVGKMKNPKASLKKGGKFRSIRTPTKEITEDLHFIRDLAEAGELRALIDKKFTLDQVPEAHRYVEQGHKRGNVVVTIVE
jgi:NADPH:quinone reductase-like Zn-dependent oxidoreductase